MSEKELEIKSVRIFTKPSRSLLLSEKSGAIHLITKTITISAGDTKTADNC